MNFKSFKMPGRQSSRSGVASHLSQKPCAQKLGASRRPPSVTAIPEEGAANRLREEVCNLFNDAQKATTGHRKLVVGLRKVQEACIYKSKGSVQTHRLNDFNEEDFNFEYMRCVIRVTSVKKAEIVGDRLVKYVAAFLKYASEKGMWVPPSDIIVSIQY